MNGKGLLKAVLGLLLPNSTVLFRRSLFFGTALSKSYGVPT